MVYLIQYLNKLRDKLMVTCKLFEDCHTNIYGIFITQIYYIISPNSILMQSATYALVARHVGAEKSFQTPRT